MGLKCLDLRGNPGLTGTAICATLIAGPRLLAPVAHLNGERVGHASAIAEWLVRLLCPNAHLHMQLTSRGQALRSVNLHCRSFRRLMTAR